MSSPETKLLAISQSLGAIFVGFILIAASIWLYKNATHESPVKQTPQDYGFVWERPAAGFNWDQPEDWRQTKPINLEYSKGLSDAVVPRDFFNEQRRGRGER